MQAPPVPRVKKFDSLLVLGCLGILGAIAAIIGLAGDPVEAGERLPEPVSARPHDVASPAPADPGQPAALGTVEPLQTARKRAESAHRSDGRIDGRLTIATSALPQLREITLTILEARNQITPPRAEQVPHTQSQLVVWEPHAPTPEFTFEHVPFSEHGYLVSAFAPGLNGSEMLVHVTKERPIAEAVLGITAGVPFSVLVRDQQQVVVADVLVSLVPQGLPQGRPMLQKNADNYGAAVFESVLRGQYKLVAGPLHAPLADAKEICVQADSGMSVQCATLCVPRGSHVNIQVFGPSGIGVQNAEISAVQTDSTLYRKTPGKTDQSGQCLLQHLAAGSYQISVHAAGYDLWARNVEVKLGGGTQQVEVRLVPR